MKNSSVSRRHFLHAAGAAAVFVPTSVGGYSSTKKRSVSPASEKEVGVSKWELDTPALCVDLDALEANLATMQQTPVVLDVGVALPFERHTMFPKAPVPAWFSTCVPAAFDAGLACDANSGEVGLA